MVSWVSCFFSGLGLGLADFRLTLVGKRGRVLGKGLGIIFFKFVYLFRKCAREQGRDIERGRERISSRLLAVSADMGLELTKREIMTWAETKSPTLD